MLVIGSYGRMRARDMMYRKAKASAYRLINYISPRAFIDAEPLMGDNNIIYAGADIGFEGRMGSDNIVRQQVYLGHEFVIGDHNIFSPGCTVGGRLRMGNRCWIGLGANIRDIQHRGRLPDRHGRGGDQRRGRLCRSHGRPRKDRGIPAGDRRRLVTKSKAPS